MKRALGIMIMVAGLLIPTYQTFAAPLNGHAEYQRDDLGYYYIVTGGQFPNGQTRNGDNASGGVFRFLPDDPTWGYTTQQWHKDDWFAQNAGFALTMKNQGQIVFDNNGLLTHSTNGYYNENISGVAGLYSGYSMSNNWDWIYAGYLKINEPTTVDTLIGFWRNGTTGGAPPINPASTSIGFRMNIWSENTATLLPAVTSFTGDIFSSDSAAGTFSWGDTGEDVIYTSYPPRDIYYLAYSLNTPITLAPGEYYFSHDAVVTPLPATLLLMGSGLAGLALWRRRKSCNR